MKQTLKTTQKRPKTVLVGTYRKDQLAKWILPKGLYNYPVGEKDSALRAAAPEVSELWLYLGKAAFRRFAAAFDREVSADELAAMGYPRGKGKPHAERYLLFRVAPPGDEGFQRKGAKAQRGRAGRPGEPRVLVRLEDFAHDEEALKAKLAKRFGGAKAGKPAATEKPLSDFDFLPDDLLSGRRGTLRVCEAARQMTFDDYLGQFSALRDMHENTAETASPALAVASTHSRELRCVSLFSGAGGLDVGFEENGFVTVFANEFDHDAADAWRANREGRRNVMVVGDINRHFGKLTKFKDVDVVFGGPPCQGFSVAGKMDPDDPRSNLVWKFMDAVEIVHPKVFVMENVAALGELGRWEGVRQGLLARAEKLGYETSLQVYHTSRYGVPENRDRMIFIGVRHGEGHIADFTAHLAKRRKSPPTVRQVLLSAGRFGSEENPETCTAGISLALHPVMRRSPYAGMLVNGAGRPIDLDGIAPTLPASMGGNKTPVVDEKALHDPNLVNWFVQYHRKLLDGTASPHATRVPSHLRRLTVKECALIQTFPPGYVFVGKKTKQYRQIGNAVPCLFAKAVAAAAKDAFFS